MYLQMAVLFAKTDWTGFAIVGPLVVTVLGALFGLYQARKADRSASTTKMTELAVKDLVDQYQEANQELRAEVASCHGECSALKAEVQELRVEVGTLRTDKDNLEADNIRLKLKAGEIKP